MRSLCGPPCGVQKRQLLPGKPTRNALSGPPQDFSIALASSGASTRPSRVCLGASF
jgi:hypothetical protein